MVACNAPSISFVACKKARIPILLDKRIVSHGSGSVRENLELRLRLQAAGLYSAAQPASNGRRNTTFTPVGLDTSQKLPQVSLLALLFVHCHILYP